MDTKEIVMELTHKAFSSDADYGALEKRLEEISEDAKYLFGYMRYYVFYLDEYDTLEGALRVAEYGSDEGSLHAEFVIDLDKRRIYPDPYVYPESYLEL